MTVDSMTATTTTAGTRGTRGTRASAQEPDFGRIHDGLLGS